MSSYTSFTSRSDAPDAPDARKQLSSIARLSPVAISRLVCVGLTFLSANCTAYEALIVHLPSTLDGSWTLACVFVIAVFFTVGGVYWERRESGPEAVSGANEESTLSLSPSSYGPTHFLALTVQAALQFTAIYFDYLAVTYAHVGDAVAIYSLSALWTPILESITSRKWPHNQVVIAVPVTILGAFLITKPSFLFGEFSVPGYPHVGRGYWFAFLASLTHSVNYVIISAHERVRWTHWIYFMSPIGILAIPIVLWTMNRAQLPDEAQHPAVLLIGGAVVGVLNLLSQIAIVLAVKVGGAATMSVSETSQIPLSYFFAYVFAGTTPYTDTLVGAALIALGIMILSLDFNLCQSFFNKHCCWKCKPNEEDEEEEAQPLQNSEGIMLSRGPVQ